MTRKKVKSKSMDQYKKELVAAITDKFGEYNESRYGLMVEKAARDLHTMALYEDMMQKAIADGNYPVVLMQGSNGQQIMKENPLAALRQNASKLAQQSLDALMLTPRSEYTKAENSANEKQDNIEAFYKMR